VGIKDYGAGINYFSQDLRAFPRFSGENQQNTEQKGEPCLYGGDKFRSNRTVNGHWREE
jgi:hypothetical protein